jgi:hypothetical protein
MMKTTPPVGPQFKLNIPSDFDYLMSANEIANTYIIAVDKFLRDYPGAAPQLGTRLEVPLVESDETRAKRAPWCADWSSAMVAALSNLQKSGRGGFWVVQSGQYNEARLVKDYQHNFAIVRPRGHTVQFLPAIDPVILLFDPWRDLLPRVYSATTGRGNAPTNIGIAK